MRRYFLLGAFLCVTSLMKAQLYAPTLNDLDKVLTASGQYDKQFEHNIEKVKKQFRVAKTKQKQYELSDKLFNLYISYCVDSAIVYAEKKLQLAKQMNYKRDIGDAKLNLAYLFIKGGQLKDASDLVESIQRDELVPSLSFYYFSTRKTLYDNLADAALTQWQRKQYTQLAEVCNDSIIVHSKKVDIWSRAEKLVNHHQDEQAKQILLEAYAKLKPYDRQMGFVAYSLAEIYRRQREVDEQKKYLIAAAISDIRNSVKEYLALQGLATILFEEGDNKRAYAYMGRALDDAVFCNARQRTIAMADVWPVIQKSHERESASRTLWLTIGLILISLLSVFLFVMIFYINRRLKELKETRKLL